MVQSTHRPKYFQFLGEFFRTYENINGLHPISESCPFFPENRMKMEKVVFDTGCQRIKVSLVLHSAKKIRAKKSCHLLLLAR